MSTDFRNWIGGDNPQGLTAPPTWFLTRLHDVDHALVLIPSKTRPRYILGRRRQFSLRMPTLVKLDESLMTVNSSSDAATLAANGLVYIPLWINSDSLNPWTTDFFTRLREMDTWEAGGWEKFNRNIVEQEVREEATKRASLLDNLDHRARDAWKSYQARSGQRNQRAGNGKRRARPLQFAPSSSGSTGTSVQPGFRQTNSGLIIPAA